MTVVNPARCRFDKCAAPLLWATSGLTGKAVPLDVDPVEPGTRGALVLIGEIVFSRVSAAQQLARMFGEPEAAADQRALDEYAWHLTHFATCPYAGQARKRGRRRG